MLLEEGKRRGKETRGREKGRASEVERKQDHEAGQEERNRIPGGEYSNLLFLFSSS